MTEDLKYHQLLKVLTGKNTGKTARFIGYSDHPKLGRMLMVEKKAISCPSGWTNPVRILPREVMEVL